MLVQPKGYEFWKKNSVTGKNEIDSDAPDWAKKEFEQYMNAFKESTEGIKMPDGRIKFVDY
ncbi:hypothetical protein HAU32_02115 [Weissella confusa]|uniref:Uncharacterized protein n=1 Tax=Weissella fermenti TaxID=2987699 RepID=A0ABT6D3F3_9LACO|nr:MULTISPECIES: hypothetical protein [Weissella]MBJ7687788.1 hypothetical protein [Weissella confusa]MCW0927059.1 hypothetical protein [Weissella sp. LMG 11983]MDF9299494.1 hypothetical protein [Weissella sp. BK2]